MVMKAVFAISIIALLLLASTVAQGAYATQPPKLWSAHPPHHVKGAATTSPTGLNPQQIWNAYGFTSLSCSHTTTSGWTDPNLCGHGQVIAIVDAYDDPTIASDLGTFSAQFGLPACTTSNGCLVKATPFGIPNSNSGWALEISLDVEWAHAIAPGAEILLVEAKSNSFSDLFNGINYAENQAGVHQVSMSWGGSEFSGEPSFDSYFQKSGVSFFASSGDSGSGTIYPSTSPYVVAVGGTTLNVDSSGNVLSETAWSGSGGGKSTYEPEPNYQVNYAISSSGARGVPDVSYDADPNTGFPVYDTTPYFGQTGWFQVGGTSAGAPQWASIASIINSGNGQLSSISFGTNTAFYNAATGPAYSQNYRDIKSGSNGAFSAGLGYDFVTGLGSPLTNGLIPYLEPSVTPDFTISANPSSLTINAGSSGSSTVTLTSLNGFAGTVTLSASTSDPSVTATLGSNSITLSSGSTGSTGLTVSASTAGTYTVTVTGTSGSLSHSTTVTVTVVTPDFSISSSPSSVPVQQGSSGSSTITVTSLNGFNSAVSLTVSAPSGITATVVPTSVTPPSGGSASSTLSISVPSTTATGTYTVTVTGTSGSLSHSTTATVTVTSSTPTPTLSVSVSANHPSYPQNSFAFITVTVQSNSTPVSGASVTLTVTLPNNGGVYSQGTGTTGSNGQVVFQVKIMPHAATGTYTATAQASASGYNPGSGSITFQVQ